MRREKKVSFCVTQKTNASTHNARRKLAPPPQDEAAISGVGGPQPAWADIAY